MINRHDKNALIIISPHFDDAILSVGGFLATQKRQITIITVCGGTPSDDSMLSNWDKLCGFSSGKQAAIERQLENINACSRLGIDSKNLLFTDFPYSEYKSSLLIADALSKYITSTDEVWTPMGIGDHPDHLITRDAVLELALKKKINLTLYADAPYAGSLGLKDLVCDKKWEMTTSPILNMISDKGFITTNPAITYLDKESMCEKLMIISCYQSQLNTIRIEYPRLTEIDGNCSIEVIWQCLLRQ